MSNDYLIINFSRFSAYDYLKKSSIRLQLENYTSDQRLEAAKNIIMVHVLSSLKDDGPGYKEYKKLIKIGFTQGQIVEAMAISWMSDLDSFYLPKLKQNRDYFSNKFILIYSLLASVFFTSILFLVERKINHEVYSYLVTIPPLIAIIGMAIFMFFYNVLLRNTSYFLDK